MPVAENRTSPNQWSIGEPDSRYGAWARRLKVGVPAKLALASGLQRRVRGGGGVVSASVVYLDASAGATLTLCGKGASDCQATAVGDTGEWKTLVADKLRLLDEGSEARSDSPLTLSVKAVGREVIVHMVEVALGEA